MQKHEISCEISLSCRLKEMRRIKPHDELMEDRSREVEAKKIQVLGDNLTAFRSLKCCRGLENRMFLVRPRPTGTPEKERSGYLGVQFLAGPGWLNRERTVARIS